MRHNCNTLEWQNLHYTVPQRKSGGGGFLNIFGRTKQDDLVVLENVTGSIHSGNLVAILGPSGSGKTTLLAAISQRLKGNVKGSIHLNGVLVDRQGMTQATSYLPQYDICAQNLSAQEHLYFMCHFKMDKRVSRSEKIQLVDALLAKVGLAKDSGTVVSRLSGGERRRLGLAEELICDPLFVFCDEPTTGLDSFNAFSVIRTLRDLTNYRGSSWMSKVYNGNMEMTIFPQNGYKDVMPFVPNRSQKGVICSIHQPSSEVFELFSHIILLSAGQVVYQGSSDDAYLFFSKLGIYCPRNCNPADFYLKLLSEGQTSTELSNVIRNNYEQEVVHVNGKLHRTSSMHFGVDDSIKKISWFLQVYYLLRRSTKNFKAAFYADFLKTIFLLITAITIGIVYMNTQPYDQSSIQNIQGLLFMIACEIIFTSTYAVVYEFPTTLPLIRREVGENMYSLSAYYTAQFLRRIPQAVAQSFLFLGTVFTFTNTINGFVTYISMGLLLSAASLTAISYGLFLSSLFESGRLSSEIAAPFDLVFMLCGGYYLNLNSIPILKYVSLFFYSYEGLSFDYWHKVKTVDCTNTTMACFQTGQEVLEEFALRSMPDTLLLDYVGLGAICVIMNCLAFCFVSRYVRKVGYY